MFDHPLRKVSAASLAITLAACGGGGGSEPEPPPPPATYGAAAAFQALLTTPLTRTVTGVGSDGKTYELTVRTDALAPAAFPLTQVVSPRARLAIDTKVEGVVTGQGALIYHYDSATYTVLGIVNSIGTCETPTATGTVPATATVDQFGLLATLDEVAGCSAGAPVLRVTTLRWSIGSDGPIRFLCLNASTNDQSGAFVGSESDCFEVDTAGALGTRARVSVTVAGTTPFNLVAKSY